MLAEYPIAATENNWLHDCMREILHSIHAVARQGQPLPNWPQIIPSDYRAKLQSRRGLKDRLTIYFEVLSQLNQDEQIQIVVAFTEQNYIDTLVRCESNCEKLEMLPPVIQKPLKDLFEFAFGLLTELGIRDEHYLQIYNHLEDHVCPFCGVEFFDAPGARREDYDHYLVESNYPLAGVNLRNLAPMGGKCNSSYKLAKDMLFKEDGTRRRSYDPYDHQPVKITLENSTFFPGDAGELVGWKIDFIPESDEAETWDDVFCIRERYERDFLNPKHINWINKFVDWYKKHYRDIDLTVENFTLKMQKYIEDLEILAEDAVMSLRILVFKLIHKNLLLGNQRVIDFVQDLLKSAIGIPLIAMD